MNKIKAKKRKNTHVPPTPPVSSEEIVANGSSQMVTDAPKFEAKRDARTPPLPAPIVKRSKSNFCCDLDSSIPLSPGGADSARVQKRRRLRRSRRGANEWVEEEEGSRNLLAIGILRVRVWRVAVENGSFWVYTAVAIALLCGSGIQDSQDWKGTVNYLLYPSEKYWKWHALINPHPRDQATVCPHVVLLTWRVRGRQGIPPLFFVLHIIPMVCFYY